MGKPLNQLDISISSKPGFHRFYKMCMGANLHYTLATHTHVYVYIHITHLIYLEKQGFKIKNTAQFRDIILDH